MERIKRSQLDHLVTELNRALGTPTEYFSTKPSRPIAVGHIHVNKNISGFLIEQTTNTGGGVREVGHSYRMTSRETWKALRCMIDAVAIAKNGGAK